MKKTEIDLSQHEQRQIIDVLQSCNIPLQEVFLFGSRATGDATPFSDVDLLIKQAKPLTWEKKDELQYAFSESDLPYLVDIVEWISIDEIFKNKIKTDLINVSQFTQGTA